MKRVLMTGATGFIGRPTLTFLKEMGYEVLAVSRQPQPAIPGVRWIDVDLFDQTRVREVMADLRPTHLLHFAWDVRHGIFWSSRENLDWVAASLNLVREFVENGGKRLVVSGTCAEYEWGPTTEPLNELTTPLVPATLYGQAKKSLFEILTHFSREAKISFAWGRIFLLYGPQENPKRLIRHVATGLVEGRRIPVTDGHQIRDFMHVDDVALAFCQLLDAEIQGAVNIGSGQPQSLHQVMSKLEILAHRQGLIGYGEIMRPTNDPDFLVPDVRRLQDEVGFHPRISLENGLKQYLEQIRLETSSR